MYETLYPVNSNILESSLYVLPTLTLLLVGIVFEATCTIVWDSVWLRHVIFKLSYELVVSIAVSVTCC